MMEAITLQESKDLIRLEQEVELGRHSWIAAGKALIEIRDRELYRADFLGFWDYCAGRWGWKQRNAKYILESYRAYLETEGVQNFAPQSASQARALSKVEPEKRDEVLEKAKTAADAKERPLTAKDISDAAQKEWPIHDDEPEAAPVPAPPLKTKDEEFLHAIGIPDAANFFASQVEDIAQAVRDDASDNQLALAVLQWEVELRKLRVEQKRRKERQAA